MEDIDDEAIWGSDEEGSIDMMVHIDFDIWYQFD